MQIICLAAHNFLSICCSKNSGKETPWDRERKYSMNYWQQREKILHELLAMNTSKQCIFLQYSKQNIYRKLTEKRQCILWVRETATAHLRSQHAHTHADQKNAAWKSMNLHRPLSPFSAEQITYQNIINYWSHPVLHSQGIILILKVKLLATIGELLFEHSSCW